MKKKELKDLEFIANGVLIENESIERMESDRRKRLLAASFVAVRNMTGMNRKEFIMRILKAIPLLLIKLGEEGMLGLMDLLGRV